MAVALPTTHENGYFRINYNKKMKRKRSSILISIFPLMILSIFLSFGLSQEKSKSGKKEREPLSKWSKQWLEEVVPFIITNAEKEFFINLPTEIERGKFIQKFWERRDPNPETPENEFKLEYYKRIALANKFFGTSGIEGWRTDRGKIYILLGPPNEIQRDLSPSETSFSTFHGPKEIWNYWNLPNPRLPYNMEFVFVDKFGTGNYVLERSLSLGQDERAFDMDSLTYHFDYMEYLTETMKNPFEKLDELKGIIRTQVTYDRIPIKHHLFYFKGLKKRVYVPLIIEIPYSALTQKEIENKYYFSLTLLVNVSNNLGQIILEKSKDINFNHTLSEINSLKDKSFQVQTSLSVEPDAKKVHLLILDNFSGMVGTSHQEISVPEFSSTELHISDIILSSKMDEDKEGEEERRESSLIEDKTFSKISNVFRAEKELNVYFEVYNLSLNPETGLNDCKIEYLFLHNGKLLAHVSNPKTEGSAEKDCRIQTSFRLNNFKPGEYILRVKVTDSNSGKSLTKEIQFIVIQ